MLCHTLRKFRIAKIAVIMRLINVHTGVIEEFIGSKIPKYAILSHTWEDEEVSLTEMSDPSARSKKGYKKIEMTCRLSAQARLDWAWVDTCCIDKSSSAELTEAINSMYRWYQRAEICYAFLSDLKTDSSLDDLKHCRWFTRGWTLQELIAPNDVQFYDGEWNNIGSKIQLAHVLSDIGAISPIILWYPQSLASVPVAQRLSWAAGRVTTRLEDIAYSLLGIFNVNMPLLYGEEEKAFRRLQEEIIKSTADLSIFAWRNDASAKPKRPGGRIYSGILAKSPKAFAWCKSLVRNSDYERQEFSISNIGVKTNIQLLSVPTNNSHASRYILPLGCSSTSQKSLGVQLRKCGPDHFIRDDPSTLIEYANNLFPNAPRTRYLLTELPSVRLPPDSDMDLLIARMRPHVLQIKLPTEMDIYDAWPWGRYDDEDQLFFVSGDPKWDSATLRLRVFFTAELDGQDTTVEFECMCYVVGWSFLEPNSVQCTLVDYQSFKTGLNEVHSQITLWEHDRHQVLDNLIHHKIPKCSKATFKIPGTDVSAVVSFKLKSMSDPMICQNKYWKMKFSCDLYKNDDLPLAAPPGVWRR